MLRAVQGTDSHPSTVSRGDFTAGDSQKKKVIVSVCWCDSCRCKNLKWALQDRVVQPYYAAFMSRVLRGGGGGRNGCFDDIQCLTSILGQLISWGHLQMLTIKRLVRFWETKIVAALNADSVWAQMSRFPQPDVKNGASLEVRKGGRRLSRPRRCCGTGRTWTRRCGCGGWPPTGSCWCPPFWSSDTAASESRGGSCWSPPPGRGETTWGGHQKRETAAKRGTHLVDGRLLDESRGLAGQDAVRRHDEDLVGSPFLQRLGRRHETVHVVDDVVLRPRH